MGAGDSRAFAALLRHHKQPRNHYSKSKHSLQAYRGVYSDADLIA
jgi:hypothetical protein